MGHGQLEAQGGGSTRERRGRVAEVCPSQAQAKRLSRSAHLLSIRLASLSSPWRAVHVEHKLLLVHETVLDDARSR